MKKKYIKAIKKQVVELRLSILEFENLKNDLVFQYVSNIKNNEPSLNLVPSSRHRSTYGCFDPLDRRQHNYKCTHCRAIVVTDKRYIATTDSTGYIFICPDCKTTEFAYHCNMVF